MVDSASLESLLSFLKGSPWSGRIYRVMLNDYPPDRENTQGARWNPPDIAAIYTCLEPAVCNSEVEYGLSRRSLPIKAGLRKRPARLRCGSQTPLDEISSCGTCRLNP